MSRMRPSADSIACGARLSHKTTDSAVRVKASVYNCGQQAEPNCETDFSKVRQNYSSRLELLKRCILELAREFPLNSGYLSRELSVLLNGIAQSTISPQASMPLTLKNIAVQTIETGPPIIFDEISSILDQSSNLIEQTFLQPGYKRVREQISNGMIEDNLTLNRQNLRLAEEIIELNETIRILRGSYNSLSKKYEDLQRTISHHQEAMTVATTTPSACNMDKDELLGDYHRVMFSPRSSNLSSRRCFSPRSNFFESEASGMKKCTASHARLSSMGNDISVQTEPTDCHSPRSTNQLRKLEVMIADNKVKCSIIAQLEHSIGLLLEKQPGCLHLTLDTLEDVIEQINPKHWQRRLQRKPRSSCRTTEKQPTQEMHCGSDTCLESIPERGRKFMRRRD